MIEKTILISGAMGFIGSNFARYWEDAHSDWKIRVLDKLTYAGHGENLAGVNYEFVRGDVCDSETVAQSMVGVAVVAHFAAETHVDRSILGPKVFARTNVEGTTVMLQEATKQKIKLFHHVSTDEVFGSLKPGVTGFTEQTPYDPSSPYSASKAGADHLVRVWHRTYGLPVTMTNTSNNYGPYQDPEKLIPRSVTNLIDRKNIKLMGRGENTRDWCHVQDHCLAIGTIIQAVLDGEQIVGETFCVGGDSPRTNLQVAQAILGEMNFGEDRIDWIPHRLGHDGAYIVDSTKIKTKLGWKPQYDFGRGITETVDWYKNHEAWWRPLLKDKPNVDPEAQIKTHLSAGRMPDGDR